VAVTAGILIAGFSPLAASGLSLIANTAPVLRRAGHARHHAAKVHGYDLMESPR